MQLNKPTLIVGATPNASRYAYIAAEMLTEYGHTIIPFGIKKGEVFGHKILNVWPNQSEVDTITLYINPSLQQQYYDQIFALKTNRIIFNPGTENQELKSRAEALGIITQYACTSVLLRTNQY